MFVLLLTYIQPLEEVDRHRAAHMEFVRRHNEAGRFIVSGRREPRTGGVILARGGSAEEMRSLIAEDPFHAHGVARYEIIEFVPGTMAPGFEVFTG